MEPKPRPESAPDVTPFNGSQGGFVVEPDDPRSPSPVRELDPSPPAWPDEDLSSGYPPSLEPSSTDASDAFLRPLGQWLSNRPRAFGVALIVVGLFFLLVHAIAVGLVLLLVGVAVAVVGTRIGLLRRQRVIDRWDTLLDGAQGHGERVVATTVRSLSAMQLPAVSWVQDALSPGVLRSIIGDTRPFLVVTHTENPRLKHYRMYVNVRDYGTNLQTSWFLAYHPPFGQRLNLASGLIGLDLFDEQDLRAYVTAVHHAFLAAVVELLANQGKDASSLNRTSRGFLGIS